MSTLLHIIATPRGEASRALNISHSFLDEFMRGVPPRSVDELDLFSTDLPEITPGRITGKFQLLAGGELDQQAKIEWAAIEPHITRFLAADAYLVTVPMWNFGIPYRLKHYLDVIVQPRHLFMYTENGPVGLVRNKKMVIVSTRGGDYSAAPQFDFVVPYLRTVFGFVGIMDVTVITAQPMDAGGPDVCAKAVAAAQQEAAAAARRF